jgi:SAM-dependent methyltransferase
VVQNQIAATNGFHYLDRVGKLKEYPAYNLPVKEVTGKKLMLDIGCGWGRWIIAGAEKGYLPVGLDIRLEFCETSLKVMKDLKKDGYVSVGDLENMPFKSGIFDLVWSFSVIQHTHYNRLINCLQGINRILKEDGFTLLEFPNKNGIRNRMGNVQENEKEKDDYNSWSVRYYTIEEYQSIFNRYLDHFSYRTHSFLGLGVLKDDLKYVTVKNKLKVSASLILTAATKLMPSLTNYADSLYIKAQKKHDADLASEDCSLFWKKHMANPRDNLNIVYLLKCPKYGGELMISDDRKKIISQASGNYYPVINNVPIIIASESITSL